MVRDKVQEKLIHLMLIRSSKQVADVFTKALHVGHFSVISRKIDLLLLIDVLISFELYSAY